MKLTRLNFVWGLPLFCWFLFVDLSAQTSAPCPQDYNRLFQLAQEESEKDNYAKAIQLLKDAETCDPSKEKQVTAQEIEMANQWENTQKKSSHTLHKTLDVLQELEQKKTKAERQRETAERSFFEVRKRELLALKQIEAEKKQRIHAEKQIAELDSLKELAVLQQKEIQKRFLKTQIELLLQEGDLDKAFRLAEYTYNSTPTLENSFLLNEVYYHHVFQIDSSFYCFPFDKPLDLNDFHPNIKNVQYSPNNSQLFITFQNNSHAMILQQQNNQQIPIEGHTGAIVAAQYSPDGESIYTASKDNSLKVWNSEGQLLSTFNNPLDRVSDLQLSHNGQYVLTAEFGRAKIWDANGYPLTVLSTADREIQQIAWSLQQEYILIHYDQTIEVWQKKGKKLRFKQVSSQTFSTSFNSLQFSPNGQYILAAGQDGTARIWQIKGKKLIERHLLKGHHESVNSAYFSPNERFIVTTSDDHTAKVWQWNESTATANVIENVTLRESESTFQIAHFSTDEQQIVTISDMGEVKFWDWLARPLSYFEGQFPKLVLSPTKYAFANSTEQEIQIRNFQNELQSAWSHQQANIHSLQFSADGKLLLSTSADSTLKIWDWQKRELLDSLKFDNAQMFAAFSPINSEVIAMGTENGFMRLYNWKSKTSIAELKAHSASINALHFSNDGQYITSSAGDKAAIIWDTQTAEKVLMLQGHESAVLHARFSEDRKYLVTASKDKAAKVWQADDSKVVRLEYKGHTSELLDARFLGNSHLILTTSKDGSAKIWNKTGKLLQSFQFAQPITAAIPSYDLQYLLFFTTEGFYVQYLDGEKLKEEVNKLGVSELSEFEKEWYGVE